MTKALIELAAALLALFKPVPKPKKRGEALGEELLPKERRREEDR